MDPLLQNDVTKRWEEFVSLYGELDEALKKSLSERFAVKYTAKLRKLLENASFFVQTLENMEEASKAPKPLNVEARLHRLERIAELFQNWLASQAAHHQTIIDSINVINIDTEDERRNCHD